MDLYTNQQLGMDLKIISYNCRSARLHFDIIKILAEQCDILMLQETLLNDENISILENIDDFNVAHTPSIRKNNTFVGRSKGGLVVMWRNFPHINIFPLHCNERVMGLKIHNDGFVYMILNVYLPCDYQTDDCFVKYFNNSGY